MVLRGHIHNNQVVFDEPVTLPEGVEVQVDISFNCEGVPKKRKKSKLETASQRVKESALKRHRKTHYAVFKDAIGQANDLPEDRAEQHDHYLLGTPKR